MTQPTPAADSTTAADPVPDSNTTTPSGPIPAASEPVAASRPIRVVVAKPGLDGHDRGIKVVARALRDAGMEVIYTGLHQTPEQIVAAALAEDADAVGLSVLSGAHMTQFRRVVALLKDADADDIIVFGGGIIPAEDITELAEIGVTGIFTPGAPTSTIVDWLRAQAAPRLAGD
jgi:methylmalonyl-CoA mutase C-terminal domain/subunit